jgi:hypothetical protein
VKELDVVGNGAGVIVNGVPFGSQPTWTKVAKEGDTVYLPPNTTYRFGIGNSYLPAATTSSGWTVYVFWSNFGSTDPAPGVVKELDVQGNGAGVIVNGVPFGSTWTKVAVEGDTVYLPPGTTYRFGIGNSYLPPATTSTGWTVYVFWSNFGSVDPDPGVVKELDVLGNGAGVIVNGIPFQ